MTLTPARMPAANWRATSDLDATVMLYESLHLPAAARMAAVRRPTGAATQRWRRASTRIWAS